MRRLVLNFCAVALLAQQEELRNPRTSPADVTAGASTFRSHCAPCHGLDATGGRGPNLAAGTFFHGSSDADLLRNISNGIPGTGMPGLFYSPDRVWQIVAYLRSLHKSSPANSAGDPGSGAELFRVKECARCHRIAGQGGRLGPDLTNIGAIRSPEHLRRSITDPDAEVGPDYWTVTLTGKDGKTVRGLLMNEDTYTVQFIDLHEQLHSVSKAELKTYKVEKLSTMPSYKTSLNEKELDDLVAYLSSLQRKGGSR